MASGSGVVKMIEVDGALMQRILGTHKPLDGTKFDPKPLLDAVEDIILRATVEGSDSKAFQGDLRYKMDHLIYEAIKKVSCELSCKCSGAVNSTEVAIGLLHLLGNYSWEAKAVITLAAFAANYGSYFLVSQLSGSNDPFVKSVAFLQLSPNPLPQTQLKLKPDALKVVKAIFHLTKYIAQVVTFQSQYTMLTSIFTAHEDDLAKAVYLSIQSTVACASLLMNTEALKNEYRLTTNEAQELSYLSIEMENIRRKLEIQMENWKIRIDGIIPEDYDRLYRLLNYITYSDNTEILRALLCWNESPATVYDCSRKIQVDINVLKGKRVWLYISKLEHMIFSKSEISIISEKYNESRKYGSRSTDEFEIVWVPIVDVSIPWNVELQKYLEQTRDSMLWYSITNPSKLSKAVIKYMKEVWKFQDKSLLVVLDRRGKFVESFGVDSIRIIPTKEPFQSSSLKVYGLWKGTIELLENSIGPEILEWINAPKYIFLFGGEDTNWIERFIVATQQVGWAAKLDIVMVYVGKSNMNWTTYERKISKQMRSEYKKIFVLNEGKYNSFWATLQNISGTKMEMEEMETLVSFDASGEEWAAVFHVSFPPMAKAKGEVIVDVLNNYAQWAGEYKEDSFVIALDKKIKEVNIYGNYRLKFSSTTWSSPKKAQCPVCDKTMEAIISYHCPSNH